VVSAERRFQVAAVRFDAGIGERTVSGISPDAEMFAGLVKRSVFFPARFFSGHRPPLSVRRL
jgi:hypothetical protein